MSLHNATSAAASRIEVVGMGSSTEASNGASPTSNGYLQKYKALLKANHPNASLDVLAQANETTCQMMPTGASPNPGCSAVSGVDLGFNIDAALALKPTLILVGGVEGSDVHNLGLATSTTLANLAAIVAKARSAGVSIRLSTVHPRNSNAGVDNYTADDITKIHTIDSAIEAAYPFYEVWDALSSPADTLSSTFDSGDGTHPNNAGHAQIFAQLIASGVQQ